MKPLEERFRNLIDSYLKDAVETNNPLINELIEDFENFRGKTLNPRTLLCNTSIQNNAT